MKMKLLVSILAIFAFGCAKPPVKAPEPKSPAPRIKQHKKKTMVCDGKPEKQIVVAVIDTGFGWNKAKSSKLCPTGHKDFTVQQENSTELGTKDPVPVDKHSHGTNVVGLIEKYAGDTDYCIVVLKYYITGQSGVQNLANTVKAIKYATTIKANFVNYSGGGVDRSEDEMSAVKAYIDAGGTFVAAAGNESSDIAVKPYYPAQDDDRAIVVGNARKTTKEEIEELKRIPAEERPPIEPVTVANYFGLAIPSRQSNHGIRVNRWEFGEDVEAYGISLTGTSQAAAIATGKIISAKICKIPVDTDSK